MINRPELPLFAHAAETAQTSETAQTALRVLRLGRARLLRRGAIAAAGIGLLGLTIARPPLPRLVWNATASAPIGLYAISPNAPIRRGDMVIAWAPPGPRRLAAERHYLPINVPLVKRVAGVTRDRVCASGAIIWINDRPITLRKRSDVAGRAMPWWSGCVTLRHGALLLLSAPPDSFDGRYFGPTEGGLIVGKATPLWVR